MTVMRYLHRISPPLAAPGSIGRLFLPGLLGPMETLPNDGRGRTADLFALPSAAPLVVVGRTIPRLLAEATRIRKFIGLLEGSACGRLSAGVCPLMCIWDQRSWGCADWVVVAARVALA